MADRLKEGFKENCYRLVETEKEVIILIDTSKANYISSWNLAKVINLVTETQKKGKRPRILISGNQENLKKYLVLNRTVDAEVI